MGTRARQCRLSLLTLGHFVILLNLGATNGSPFPSESSPTIESIIQFGDSLSDTGNFGIENPQSPFCLVNPYGETTFGHPTGRCSDGLIIVDFLANAFALPLLNPYLNQSGDFNNGVNFAVVGATALDAATLADMNITSPYTNSSLMVQIGWFRDYLQSTNFQTQQERHAILEKTLFIMGEIGGNDFNYALLRGPMTPEETTSLYTQILGVIQEALKEVIESGATKVFVPGIIPGGCLPIYLSMLPNDDPNIFDDLHCAKDLNSLSQLYNMQLQQVINDVQQQYPSATMIYGDYYSAFISLLQNAPSLGFEVNELFMVCCGKGDNPYNFGGFTQFCGIPGVESCPDPTKRIHWDGIHLTQQAYQYMAQYLLPSIQGINP